MKINILAVMNNKNQANKYLYALVNLLLVGVMAVLIWRAFNVPALILMRDDMHTLADRVWFAGNAEWLEYLLFFSQNRYVAMGDNMLVRPLLFLHHWALDVFFRADRAIHYWDSFAISIFSAGTIFWIARRFVPIAGALALAVSFLVLPKGYSFEWSTISPYLLSISFFGLGLVLLLDDQEEYPDKISWRSLTLLSLSTLFHELAALSILVLTVLALLFENKKRRSFTFHLIAISVAWLLMYLTVILLLKPDGFIGPGVMDHVVSGHFDSYGSIKQYIKTVIHVLAYPISACAVTLFMSVWYVFMSSSRPSWNKKWLLFGFVTSIFAMTAGLALGRVAIRLGFHEWYEEMYYYYLLVICAIFMGLIFRKNTIWKTAGWVLVICLLVLDVRLLVLRADRIQDREGQFPIWSELTGDMKQFFEENPDKCMAGIRGFDSEVVNERFSSIVGMRPLRDFDVARDLNTAFYYYSCGVRSQAHPTYFNVTNKDLGTTFSFKATQESWHPAAQFKAMDLTRDKVPYYFAELLAKQSKRSKSMIWGQSNPPNVEANLNEECMKSKSMDFSELSMNFLSSDVVPISYNFGVRLETLIGKEHVMIFHANAVEISEFDIPLAATETSTSLTTQEVQQLNSRIMFLNSMPETFSVRLKSAATGIEVFFQEQLLGRLKADLSEGPYVIQVCPFDNHTPIEQVQSITYVPLNLPLR